MTLNQGPSRGPGRQDWVTRGGGGRAWPYLDGGPVLVPSSAPAHLSSIS